MQHTKTEEEAFDTVGISVCTSIDAGVPLPRVAARLGHRDLTTTGRIYAHRTQRADEYAAIVVEALLSGVESAVV